MSQFGLSEGILFSPACLGIVVFDLDPLFKTFMLYIFKLLRLDDVIKIAFVAVLLQLLQKVQLVVLEFFDAAVEAVD